ncbi:hypothetical protein S7711_03334 [Stachybotrys chartarum IBT 7711]|uniref:Uncharacterized protein n=1 Tax=Stachybotrys chartarum (strain CBS 109288 / IBT 7711) TaxID=1280523 RepID=A0A084AUQ6_STACB|nr:hypothetical protein S7711_03334 [Stachybotrys chartarum IBT 7711]
MMTPRSFLYSHRSRPPGPGPGPGTGPASPPSSLSPSSFSPSNSKPRLSSASHLLDSKEQYRFSSPPPDATITEQRRQSKYAGSGPVTTTTSTRFPTRAAQPSHSSTTTTTTVATFNNFDATMAKRKERREPSSRPMSSSSNSTVDFGSQVRPSTPTSPVQIPKNSNRETAHPQKRHATHRRRAPREVHTPDSISPTVAALLAVTDIPRPRRSHRRKRQQEGVVLTLDDIINGSHISEKELSLSLTRGPLDVLLTPPEDFDDIFSITDSNVGSVLSTRTGSADSMAMLGHSFATDLVSSIDAPCSPASSTTSRRSRRRASPMRRSLEPVRSPPDAIEEHPLATDGMLLDETEDDYDSLADESFEDHFERLPESVEQPQAVSSFKPLRTAFFKSNLTASLRALRSAAKSFSTINFSSIPTDDFLTRSILTMDPKVPYTDERRPPVSEEMPSAELRRYLNPTSSNHENQTATSSAANTFSASIQMQTYKVQRSRSAPPSSRSPHVISRSQSSTPPPPPPPSQSAQERQAALETTVLLVPGMRQREMRENPDFIRIAVMEMAMRRQGKLDDQSPGRARWALPPRKTPATPYEVGANGVPARWIPVVY